MPHVALRDAVDVMEITRSPIEYEAHDGRRGDDDHRRAKHRGVQCRGAQLFEGLREGGRLPSRVPAFAWTEELTGLFVAGDEEPHRDPDEPRDRRNEEGDAPAIAALERARGDRGNQRSERAPCK